MTWNREMEKSRKGRETHINVLTRPEDVVCS